MSVVLDSRVQPTAASATMDAAAVEASRCVPNKRRDIYERSKSIESSPWLWAKKSTVAPRIIKCKVAERTLRRWLRNDVEFQAEYAASRTATFEAGMNRVQGLTGLAVDALASLLEAGNQPSVRLGAARTVLEIAMHHFDAEKILARLAELETLHLGRS